MIYYYSRLIRDESIKSNTANTINTINTTPLIDLSLYPDSTLLKAECKTDFKRVQDD